MKEAVARYKKVADAKVNFDKSEGLWLGAWRGSIPLPGPFNWSDDPVRILGVWFRPGLQLERNWLEVRAKVEAQVGAWLQRRLCVPCTSSPRSFTICPYFLCLRIIGRWKGGSPLVHRRVCYQHPRDGGLGIPDLKSHWLAERLAYLGRSLTTGWSHLPWPEVVSQGGKPS